MGDVIRERLNEEYVNRVSKKYADRFKLVEEYYPSFDDNKKLQLGMLLENTEEEFRRRAKIYEGTQVANVAEGLKNQYFDIITASFPGLIAEELFSVQPIQQKTGAIFYLKYVYGNDKGRTKKGNTIFGNMEIAGYENSNYTAELVEDEPLFVVEAENAETKFEGNLDYIPLQPGKVAFIGADGARITDDGEGNLAGTGVAGTINYATGAYVLNFTAAPKDNEFTATYEYDLSYAPATIPQIDLKVVESLVTARPRKLRGTYSLDAAYDLQQAQNVNIETSLLEAASMQLRHEIDGSLIRNTFNQAGLSTSWTNDYKQQQAYVAKKDYYENFIEKIFQGASSIFQATKRVRGNYIVCGKRAMDILKFIGAPRFVSAGNVTAVGPHYAGMLDGDIKVYCDPFLGETEFLIGYKGNTLIDAGKIYAPYLPFFATETIMLDDFVGRRGFASSYGEKMVNANLYVKGGIIEA